MSTQQIVYSMAKQPKFAQELIEKMAQRLFDGKEALYITSQQMTPKMQVWLEREGFDVEYDKRVHEFKVNLI